MARRRRCDSGVDADDAPVGFELEEVVDGVLRVVGKKMVWAASTGERSTARASRMLRRNSGELRGLDPPLHNNEQRGGLRVRQDTGKELG